MNSVVERLTYHISHPNKMVSVVIGHTISCDNDGTLRVDDFDLGLIAMFKKSEWVSMTAITPYVSAVAA